MFVESGVFAYKNNGKICPEREVCLVCLILKKNHGTECSGYNAFSHIIHYSLCAQRRISLAELEHYYFKKCLYRTAKVELLF